MFRLTEVSEQVLVLIHFLAGRRLRLIRARSIHNGSKYLLEEYRVGFRQKKTKSIVFPGLCEKSCKYHWFWSIFPAAPLLTDHTVLSNNLSLKHLWINERTFLLERGFQTRAGIGIPKYRKYREIPKFGIPKYRKFQYWNFQYYRIPKISVLEFSILLNIEKNFNTEVQ